MSNIFNINRFSKVVVRDIVSNCLILVFRGLLFFGVYYLLIALWGLLVVNSIVDMSASFRYETIVYALSVILMLVVPFILYNNVSNRKKGVDYIMLPASTLEKYLSMLFVTITIGQLIILSTGFIVDTLFSVIFPNIFEGFAITKIDFMGILKNQGKVLVLVSVGIAGNLMFRKHKALKTISVFIVLILIFIFCSINYIVSKFVNQPILSINNKEYTIKGLNKGSNLKDLSTAYIEYDNKKQIKDSHNFEKLKQKFGVNNSSIIDFKSLMKNVNTSNHSVHSINLKTYNATNSEYFYMDIYTFGVSTDEEVSYAVITKGNVEYFIEISSYPNNISFSAFSEYNEIFKDFLSKIKIFVMWIFPIILLLLSYIRLKKIQM